ncbi:phosphatidate cytidylyltransferase [Arcanobacterium haemolyticum]|nr:phosphatidate cytidylyltransferase [Arcanobacterium haemolyticum]
MSNSFKAAWARIAPRPPAPPAQSHSRAGRNLKAAVPTALGLLLLVALSVIVRIEIFVVLVTVAIGIGLWEAAGAFLKKNIRVPIVLMWLSALAMLACTWFFGLYAALPVYMVASGLIFAARLIDGEKRSSEEAIAAIFALGWIAFLGCFAVALAAQPHAPWLIAVLVVMPAASDTGGWLLGTFFGKHPMSPTISPKKSWEGLGGSFLVALLVSFILVGLVMHRPWYVCLLIAVAAVLCATLGDLSESMLKRELDVKDMGTLFPGHGGMLDRIDSILMWAPFCFLIMTSPFAL